MRLIAATAVSAALLRAGAALACAGESPPPYPSDQARQRHRVGHGASSFVIRRRGTAR